MKRLALVLIGVSLVALVIVNVLRSEPRTAGEYVDAYGGSHGTYAGILRDTRCERLWELHELDVHPGYRIAAGDRYNALCAEQ